jgi:hypothetical protein
MVTTDHAMCVRCRLTTGHRSYGGAPVLDADDLMERPPRRCCWCGDEVLEYEDDLTGTDRLSCLGMHVPDTVEDALRDLDG